MNTTEDITKIPTDATAAGSGSNLPPSADWWGDAPREPSGGEPRKTPTIKVWIAAGVGAAVLVAGSVFGINALSGDSTTASTSVSASANGSSGGSNSQGGPGGGTVGTIKSIDGSTITLTSSNGGSESTVTVTTDSDTEVTISEDATASDLKVGDNVMVMGSGSSDSIEASSVVDSGDTAASTPGGGPSSADSSDSGSSGSSSNMGTPPEKPSGSSDSSSSDSSSMGEPPSGGSGDSNSNMQMASGTIESIDGDTITVKTDSGTVTVTLTDDTDISVSKTGKVSDLKEGDTIMVDGTTSDSTVAATSIREGSFGGPSGGNGGEAPSGSGSGNSSSDSSN